MTTKIMAAKKRIKELTKENIMEILYLLQPVSYTDNEHQADYYGYGYGAIIKAKQQAFIAVLKHNIIKCNTKVQIGHLFSVLNNNINYFPGFVVLEKKKKGLTEFWEGAFGSKVLSEWKWNINKFVSHLNDMVEV